jgi:branched-chain amino acid transport system permease protein
VIRGGRLATSYGAEMTLLGGRARRPWVGACLVAAVLLPYAASESLTYDLAVVCAAAVAAIGLNIVLGWAGQVSLGHAFFIGVGAYTAAVLGGEGGNGVIGLGLDMAIWLPAAGLVAALAGLAVAPIAFRLRGLYLAVVTLGLVFIGEYVFRTATRLTGGTGTGRDAATPELFGVRVDEAGLGLGRAGGLYLLALAVLVVMAILARNLTRSSVGREFAAVRDRDVAAAIMGVPIRRTKTLAFVLSSFYAGIGGALLFLPTGFIEPGSFDLLLSVQYIAMVLIGGIATISGAILGAAFVILLPRIVAPLADVVPGITDAPTGGVLTTFQLEQILYGLLIVAFLVLEPRGVLGLWGRIRTLARAWPLPR